MGTRIALCIMAKAPEAGRVKTRLSPPLSPEDAAELYRCFLLDKIAQVREVAGMEPVLAHSPPKAVAVFAALAPGFALLAQRGADLTARLVAVCDEIFRGGFDAAILIDSDTPTFPTERLERAVALMIETLRRARALGLSSTRLEAWYDVDTAADLVRLQAGLADDSDGGPRHTRRFLLERFAGRTVGAEGRI